jgi:hypothetical protein
MKGFHVMPRPRSASRHEALTRCEGFSVRTPSGEIGIVEEVRVAEAGQGPVELVVRSRAVARREIALVGVEDVYRVDSAERLILVRGRIATLHHRVAASVLSGAATLSFLAPSLVVSIDRRVARATGLDLVAGSPVFSGSYVHDAYVGDVEALAGQGHVAAAVAFAIAAAGVLVGWGRGRRALLANLLLAVAGLATMWALWQTTSPGARLSTVEHRYGYWLVVVFFFACVAWAARGLWSIRRA